jgi:hypothetical protein
VFESNENFFVLKVDIIDLVNQLLFVESSLTRCSGCRGPFLGHLVQGFIYFLLDSVRWLQCGVPIYQKRYFILRIFLYEVQVWRHLFHGPSLHQKQRVAGLKANSDIVTERRFRSKKE